MSAYVIASVKFNDMAKYRAEWQAKASEIHDKHGGKMLARTDHPDVLAGAPHDGSRMVILEFPDKATARAWWSDMEEHLHDDNVGPHGVAIVDGIHA